MLKRETPHSLARRLSKPCAQLTESLFKPPFHSIPCSDNTGLLTEKETPFFLAQPTDHNWAASLWVPLGYSRQKFPMPLLPDFLIESLDCPNLQKSCHRWLVTPSRWHRCNGASRLLKAIILRDISALLPFICGRFFLLIHESENQMCNTESKQLLSIFGEGRKQGGERMVKTGTILIAEWDKKTWNLWNEEN